MRHGGVLGRGEAGEDSDRLQTMTDRDRPKTQLEQHPGESILSTWPATTATGVAVKKQEFEKSQPQKKAIQQQLQQALDRVSSETGSRASSQVIGDVGLGGLFSRGTLHGRKKTGSRKPVFRRCRKP